jgi:hypothetical protein
MVSVVAVVVVVVGEEGGGGGGEEERKKKKVFLYAGCLAFPFGVYKRARKKCDVVTQLSQFPRQKAT